MPIHIYHINDHKTVKPQYQRSKLDGYISYVFPPDVIRLKLILRYII